MRRSLLQGEGRIDYKYSNFEINECFQSINIIAYKDLNQDSIPDNLSIQAISGPNHEKINFIIKNLIVGQQYNLKFIEWSNAIINEKLQQSWIYGCAISNTEITQNTPGRLLFSDIPYWEPINVGGFHEGNIIFTATANTMYWVWDFGAVSDNIEFTYKITDIKLELVPPVFNFQNINIMQGKGTYELVNYTNTSVNFNFTGASGVEVINWPISGLAKNQQYRITFSENYHGNLIENTYQYGCTISNNLTLTNSGKPINCSITFDTVNTEGTRESTFTFKPTATTSYWIWDFGRWQDSFKNNVSFIIIKLEILSSDGSYKTLIG